MRTPVLAASLLLAVLAAPAAPAAAATADLGSRLDRLLDEAEDLGPLHSVAIAVDGGLVASRGYGGHTIDEPTNIKSASKTIVAALVGIAIGKGSIEGVDQPIAPILKGKLPPDADPRLARVTIGNLLSMQAGLAPTSGPDYGAWVKSRDWVRAALDQPFVEDPGGPMVYSTGSTHLLSAILTLVTGRSTLELARDWLRPVKSFRIASWARDPQGIYLGGNQMAMSPRSLLAFGELYRNGGRAPDGTEVVPRAWVEASFRSRTQSRFTGDGYGYGWFLRRIGGREVRYAWGYGGQMLYIVPSLDLTVVMTSDETRPSARTGHRDRLHRLLERVIAIVEASPRETPAEPAPAAVGDPG